jgi:hypothetical protein
MNNLKDTDKKLKAVFDEMTCNKDGFFSYLETFAASLKQAVEETNSNFVSFFYIYHQFISELSSQKSTLNLATKIKIISEIFSSIMDKYKKFNLYAANSNEILNLYFSNALEKKTISGNADSIKMLAKDKNSIALVPSINKMSDGWWLTLLENKAPLIFAKFDDVKDNNFTENDSIYAIGHINDIQNLLTSERLILVIKTSSPISKDFLKQVLNKNDMALYSAFEQLAQYNGTALHFVEILNNKEKQSLDDFSVEQNDTNFNIEKVIGGYSTLIADTDDEKIAVIPSFNK